ncbi:DUF2889 domain-containing protein [Pacificitalea manganoxidans]|uniref:DUF2889 domain-containing protein n=1 Tax=Pacificitalea manganoxidans TaxID=1411902 RepID=UPI0012FDF37D|nr:DUF2889 domain-containing protein [Pacificitalea manganoxidans]MDR6310061.1 hypothetical protein [Pacificitalea manganoxidans]
MASRALNHTRRVSFQSYDRDDGLFDIEGRIVDAKDYPYFDRERGELAPGDPVHDISVRMTIGDDLTVRAIEVSMDAVPFTICGGGATGAEQLVGTSIADGWRRRLSDSLGRTAGCTHLRELLLASGTVAFQTISGNRDQRFRALGHKDEDRTDNPFFLNGCHSWSEDGPIVARYFPQYAAPGKDRD